MDTETLEEPLKTIAVATETKYQAIEKKIMPNDASVWRKKKNV